MDFRQGFRIQDITGMRVDAVAQFMFRGYEVSMSQIFTTPSEIAVLHNDRFVHLCSTVEEAIEWILEQ